MDNTVDDTVQLDRKQGTVRRPYTAPRRSRETQCVTGDNPRASVMGLTSTYTRFSPIHSTYYSPYSSKVYRQRKRDRREVPLRT